MTDANLLYSLLKDPNIETDRLRMYHGDCLDIMPTKLDECSIDAIVTDPPYGLNFMGKGWDHGVPGRHFWKEALRVAKPGAHMCAFGGTRTWHRLTVCIEDAGWQIRDTIMWIYGQGFPKGDTNLKPAWEPVVLCRKPVKVSIAENVKKWGTGRLNIDDCRVGSESRPKYVQTKISDNDRMYVSGVKGFPIIEGRHTKGRWPANLIHDGSEEVIQNFPHNKGPGVYKDPDKDAVASEYNASSYNLGKKLTAGVRRRVHSLGDHDGGNVSRFFYCAKVSPTERANSTHPTLKPQFLLRYLCKLITPPNGIVLDQFMGRGSTLKAALSEGFRAVGIEKKRQYFNEALDYVR